MGNTLYNRALRIMSAQQGYYWLDIDSCRTLLCTLKNVWSIFLLFRNYHAISIGYTVPLFGMEGAELCVMYKDRSLTLNEKSHEGNTQRDS